MHVTAWPGASWFCVPEQVLLLLFSDSLLLFKGDHLEFKQPAFWELKWVIPSPDFPHMRFRITRSVISNPWIYCRWILNRQVLSKSGGACRTRPRDLLLWWRSAAGPFPLALPPSPSVGPESYSGFLEELSFLGSAPSFPMDQHRRYPNQLWCATQVIDGPTAHVGMGKHQPAGSANTYLSESPQFGFQTYSEWLNDFNSHSTNLISYIHKPENLTYSFTQLILLVLDSLLTSICTTAGD